MDLAQLGALSETIDPEAIADPATREAVSFLLNVGEHLLAENRALQAEVRRLRAELARLKGEPPRSNLPGADATGKPAAGAGAPKHSSEAARQARTPRKPWQKRGKLDRLAVDRTVKLTDPGPLPPDAQFKGYEAVVVQDLVLRTDNVRFLKAKFYSPTTGRTYLAPLPPGYAGEFGPGLKALALSLVYGCHLSQPLLHAFFQDAGVVISRGQVARLVTEGQERFHTEQQAVLQAGLASSPWQHLDTTPTFVDGVHHACHVLGNPLFTVFTTTARQDRASVVDVLRGGAPRTYRLDATAFALLREAGLAQWVLRQLATWPQEQTWDAPAFQQLLDWRLPGLGPGPRKQVEDAAAIAAYRADPDWPVVRCLVTDDAATFRWLTEELALCWIHDGRHYQKLAPQFACFQRALARFRKRYWDFYRELLAYREAPSQAEAVRLEAAFDTLFATETRYADLNVCIRRTQANREKLLRVLAHPELPLHNNPAELAARRRARKRDVSFGPRSPAGTRAWDTFQSLAATTGQLGVRFTAYLRDRLTGSGQIPPLADLIRERAAALRLDASWQAT